MNTLYDNIKAGPPSKQPPGRSAALDSLRLAAALLVIFTHTIQNDADAFPPALQPLSTGLWVLAMICNPLYVLLSGALLCPWREESLPRFLIRRFIAAALPMALYYAFVVTARAIVLHPEEPFTPLRILTSLLTGNTPEAPQYWLIYLILALYPALYLARHLLRGVSYGGLCRLALGLCPLWAALRLLSCWHDMHIFWYLRWLLIALWGFWVSRPETRRYDRVILPSGAAAAAAIFLTAALCPEGVMRAWCVNDRELPVLAVLGLAAALLSRDAKKQAQQATAASSASAASDAASASAAAASGGPESPAARLRRVIPALLRRHSYGMILIHWAVIHMITRRVLRLSAASAGGIGGILLCTLVNTLFSLLCAFLLDTFLVFPLQKLLRALTDRAFRGAR